MLSELLSRLSNLLQRSPNRPPRRAVVLSGGGARAAYQAGVLNYVGEVFPELQFSIITGVSAGAINAAHLGNFDGSLRENGAHLVESWTGLTTEDVFREESGFRLLMNFFRSASRGGDGAAQDIRGLVDTSPLRDLLHDVLDAQDGQLERISRKVQQGTLRAVALATTNYATGQTVNWTQGRDVDLWERPNRISIRTQLTVDHVMASAALPLLFPAVRLGDAWYGDGGIRLTTPLAPAIHLGADAMLVISTRYRRSRAEASEPLVQGYPPAAQIIGILMNAMFLDVLDQDASMVRRINRLVRELPRRKRHGMRPIRLLEIRPSVDIGKLSGDYEATLPGPFRFLTRGLGTNLTQSPDWLSLLLFEKEYLQRLIEIGYDDARNYHNELERLLGE